MSFVTLSQDINLNKSNRLDNTSVVKYQYIGSLVCSQRVSYQYVNIQCTCYVTWKVIELCYINEGRPIDVR